MSQTRQQVPSVTSEVRDDTLTAVVRALEDVVGTRMEEIPLVSNSVNVDAMCELIDEDPTGTSEVHFDYESYHVVVTADCVEVYQ